MNNGDYPKTKAGLRKLVSKLDLSLFQALLKRDELREACEQLLAGFVKASSYPNFDTDPDEFIRLATIETRARLALGLIK